MIGLRAVPRVANKTGSWSGQRQLTRSWGHLEKRRRLTKFIWLGTVDGCAQPRVILASDRQLYWILSLFDLVFA